MLGVSLLAACGAAQADDTAETRAGGAAGSAPTGGSGGSIHIDAGGGGIGLIGSGGTIKDAATDPVVVTDAGWFECGGCLCDGATSYCLHVTAGPPLYPAPPPDATLCPDDAGSKGCKPLPSACNGVPSCGCVELPRPLCNCDDAGGGILVSCSLP